MDFSAIKRVLIIKLRHHGDVLMVSPMFRVLRERYPHLEVDALVYLDTRPMLAHHPDIAELFTIDRNWKKLGLKKQLQAEVGLIKALKGRQYDLVLHMTDHWRGALLTRLLKPRYAVSQRHPKRKQNKFWLKTFSHNFEVNFKKRHMVEKHLDALRVLGLHPEPGERRLLVFAGDEAESQADALLSEHGLTQGQYLLVHPTSRWSFKNWESRHMAEVINDTLQCGIPVVVTASPDAKERAFVDSILEQCLPGVINLAGQTRLEVLFALIAKARCLLSVDSVPMHIASATDTPCVAIFGPSNEVEWGPWMNQHRVIASAHSCRPCDLAGCADSWKSDCLVAVEPKRVKQALVEVMACQSVSQ